MKCDESSSIPLKLARMIRSIGTIILQEKGCLKNPSFGWVCGGPVWIDSKLLFASRCFIYVRPTCRFAISDSLCCSNCESLQPPWVFRWSTTCTCSSTCSWWCLGHFVFKLLVPPQMKTWKHVSNFAKASVFCVCFGALLVGEMLPHFPAMV